ncbi:MAG: efflux RND transporter periplasmic adaptor subunit [Nitrospirae bacterium]|nr:MAG: efflux RND transporter periplasmic adaptor subunit [Nitrospirota bacterium]
MRQHKLSFIVILLCVALLSFFLCWTFCKKKGATSIEEKEHATEHEHHEGEHEERVVSLSGEELREFGIELGKAKPGKLKLKIRVPGEIVINADHLVHVVPRVSGIVTGVFKNIGDKVIRREVVAILDSREIADAKASFLAMRKRVEIARENYKREENLWKQKISSKQDYLNAKQVYEEALIELNLSEQKLHNLGLSHKEITRLAYSHKIPLTRYRIFSPANGTVIKKHITLGEVLKEDALIFVIADMSSVWVDLNVYQKDLPYVVEGQRVIISKGNVSTEGEIYYVSPLVNEQTRTALARVVLKNKSGRWRPGLFVTGEIYAKEVDVPLLVDKTGIFKMDGETCIFLKTEEGFKLQKVKTGREDDERIEVIKGIREGDQYVVKGVFILKSELQKKSFSGEHEH